MKTSRFTILAAVSLIILLTTAAQATSYTMRTVALGTAYAVNDAGQIVGNGDSPYSFIWQNGNTTQLPPANGMQVSDTRCISNTGQAAGCDIYYHTYAIETRAWVWQSGSKTSLSSLGGYTGVLALNNLGQVLGYSYDSQNVKHTVVWNGNSIQDLGALNAVDINNSGVMCGITAGQYAVFYDHGTTVSLGRIYSNGTVRALNNLGHVVGASNGRATLWRGGASIDLGTPGYASQANDINDLGQVAGWFYTSSGKKRAFVWDNGIFVDLGTLAGGVESEALGINSNGWIVGYSTDSRGNRSAVLWEPIVPEPQSFAVILCGLAGMAVGVKRRRV